MVGRCGKSEREAGLTSYNEYRLLLEGHEQELRERMEVARWICFHIYAQNPYIKEPKARTLTSYVRFPWEEKISEEEQERILQGCQVSPEEQAELDRIFKAVFGDKI